MVITDVHDFQKIVAEARDECNSVEPQVVAELVYTTMTDQERIAAFKMILPDAVRRILNDPPTLTSVEPNPIADTSTSEQNSDLAGSMSDSEPKVGPIQPGQSRKFVGYFMARAFAPEFGSKMLGDLTRDMVDLVAKYRLRQSAELAAKAAHWEKLLLTMIEYGAEHVRDLPESQVRDILNGDV